MPEITFIVDDLRGVILAEDNQDFRADGFAALQKTLGEAQTTACARPLEIIKPPDDFFDVKSKETTVRIAGYYHNSLTEGPGRRSSVLFQFCPLKCKGCYVPELHDKNSGAVISVKKLAELLLDPNFERDGVSILGGEPFAQPDALLTLVKELRSKNCPHIICYSGYTLESLREKSLIYKSIGDILDEIDILIDGAFVESLASSAGLWTGSGNQRVIDLRTNAKYRKNIIHGKR
ncbi:MAG: 4Fe-4S single cluster domain-containing protein [Pyrinomonadaceae bacterium]